MGGKLGNIIEHVDYVKSPGKKLKLKHKTLTSDQYKDENEVLYWLVHKNARQKTDYYGKKIKEMEKKYEMDFPAFKNVIHSSAGTENLEQWNDFILWAGYLKAYRYWKDFC